MALTALGIEKLKPGKSRREIADDPIPGLSGKLFLLIQPSGSRSWAVRYWQQKRHKLTLGDYPAISLADARKLTRLVLTLVAEGKDPRLTVRRIGGAADSAELFPAIVRLFVERHARPRNRRWWESARLLGMRVETDDTMTPIPGGLCDRWALTRVGDITRRDIIDFLDGLAATSPISANRHLAALRKFFNWCVSRDMIAGSPCAGVKAPSPERSRDRVLSHDEIRALWRAADAEGWPFGHITKLLILTGQRRDEIAGMLHSEVDAKAALLTLTPDRTKNARPHVVPLSPPALEILQAMPRIEGCRYVFSTNGRTPASGFSKSKTRIDAAMGDVAPWRLHDLRRVFSTGCNDLKVPPHIVERILNHVSGTFKGVAGIYNKAEYLDEKRAALEAWAAHVVSIAHTRNGS
jgi:integrase